MLYPTKRKMKTSFLKDEKMKLWEAVGAPASPQQSWEPSPAVSHSEELLGDACQVEQVTDLFSQLVYQP